MAPIRLLAHRLRSDRLPDVLLLLVALAAAALAASVPLLLNRAADDGLKHEIAAALPVERGIELGRITWIEADAEAGMGTVADVADDLMADLPASVRDVISDRTHLAESVRWIVLDRPPIRPGFLELRFQGGLDDEIRLVDGRLPTGEVTRVEPVEGPPSSVPATSSDAPLFEIALSNRAADELGVGIGDRMNLVPDVEDPLVGRFGPPNPAAAVVTGIFDTIEPGADVWAGDPSLQEPTLVPVGLNVVEIHATALLAPEAYPELETLGFPARYLFRHTVDPDRFHAGMLDQLRTDLERMTTQYPSFGTTPDPTRTTLRTALPSLADAFVRERRTTEAILVTASIGPTAIAAVTLFVVSLLGVERRRRSLATMRGRGGSAVQLVGAHLLEALLVTVPAAALAAWLTGTLVDARWTPVSLAAAGAAALVAVLVFVAASVPAVLGSLRGDVREEAATGSVGQRRLVFEGLVVGLAIGGVVLLRQRGLVGGSASGALGGVDPFLAGVPALVGLAVGIVTLRVYPVPIRVAGLLAAGSRGLVPALGLRRAERRSGVSNLPLVVLLLTVAIGAFSSTMLATIDRGQVAASWNGVGAAHRLTAPEVGSELPDLSANAGVEAVAGLHEGAATLGLSGRSRIDLAAIDAAEYEAVTKGTPIETRLPPSFSSAPSEERTGTSEQPIPAIVSAEVSRSGTEPLRAGQTFIMMVQGRFATFEATEIRSELPTLPAERAFVVVPRAWLEAAMPDRRFAPTSLFVRAPADSAGALRAIADGAGVTFESQDARLGRFRDRPLVGAVGAGFSLALLVAIGFAALASIVAMLLSGSARARETAQLRTLGLGRAQVLWLTFLEHGPMVAIALLAGAGLGVAVAWVVLPGLGLGGIVGVAGDPPLTIDLGRLVLLALAVTLIVAVGIGLAAWAQNRADPARTVREGV